MLASLVNRLCQRDTTTSRGGTFQCSQRPARTCPASKPVLGRRVPSMVSEAPDLFPRTLLFNRDTERLYMRTERSAEELACMRQRDACRRGLAKSRAFRSVVITRLGCTSSRKLSLGNPLIGHRHAKPIPIPIGRPINAACTFATRKPRSGRCHAQRISNLCCGCELVIHGLTLGVCLAHHWQAAVAHVGLAKYSATEATVCRCCDSSCALSARGNGCVTHAR